MPRGHCRLVLNSVSGRLSNIERFAMSRIIGQKVLHYDQVTSTNDLARTWAEEGEPEGLVISAQMQTDGRGRMGRTWTAPPGTSILLSVLLRPPLLAIDAPFITQMAAVTAFSALLEIVDFTGFPSPARLSLKWPNDVLLNGKKCAGILVETGFEDTRLNFAVVGFGINVNFSMRDFPDLAPFATTLSDELGRTLDRDRLEGILLTRMDEYYHRLCSGKDGQMAIFEEWRSRLGTIGQAVRIATPSGEEEGVAVDVAGDGSLILRRRGDLIRLYTGDVTVLKDADQRRLE
jgi:BirA family biotin operon repressor/biotin-[acetyl-CoA-carboxylase] ligase